MIEKRLIYHLAKTHQNPARAFTLAAAELPDEARAKLARIARALRVPWKPPDDPSHK